MNPKTLFLFPFLFSSSLYAAQIRTLDEMRTIDVSISRQDLTRITVKEDRILNVFGNTGDYVLETDDSQGQIFIRPAQQENKKPFSLTLTTERGRTQDLRLIPKDQPCEALVLKVSEESQKDTLKGKCHVSKEEVESLLEACRAGRIPLGYKHAPLHLRQPPGPYKLVQELSGESLRCLTYEVSNSLPPDKNNKQLLKLSEPQFAHSLPLLQHNIIAVMMPKHTLDPGEKTYVYVIIRTD